MVNIGLVLDLALTFLTGPPVVAVFTQTAASDRVTARSIITVTGQGTARPVSARDTCALTVRASSTGRALTCPRYYVTEGTVSTGTHTITGRTERVHGTSWLNKLDMLLMI